jgi:dTDP-4-amino-4,6-dideoxygalactose transaminase
LAIHPQWTRRVADTIELATPLLNRTAIAPMRTATVAAPSVPFAPPSLGDREIAEVVATLESGWLSTGPRVSAFEEAFAAYVGARHAIALNSGTAALHLALLASDIGTGDEVVTTPLTFCATANAIVHTGARPIFADIDPTTWNLDANAAAAAITPRTRALLPVHYAGRPVDMHAMRAVAARKGLKVIEDAAHCVEGVAGGTKVGSIGHFTCFSFYATKNVTTGEGGMVTTSDDRAAAYIRAASLHGLSKGAWSRYAPGGAPQYDVLMAGFKYNMMDIQAAIGLHQLARVQEMHARRTEIWSRYDEALAGLPLTRPAPVAAGDVHARHLYTVLVDERAAGVSRDGLQQSLRGHGISTSVHFRALHLHPYYQERFGVRRGMFPAAEAFSDTTLSLPLSAGMPEEAVDRVIEALHDILK